MRGLFAGKVSLMVVVVEVCFAPGYQGQEGGRKHRGEAGHVTGLCRCILVVAYLDYLLAVLQLVEPETSAFPRN